MSELARSLDAVWAMLEAGVDDRDAPARHPVLATSGATGPEVRMLVLRGADRAAGTLRLHTDAATGKVRELKADPRAALLVWDGAARLQVRLRAHVAVRPGSAGDWAALPEAEPALYGGTPLPGTPLPAPEAHRPAPDPARFAVLSVRIDEIETLRLGAPHARAVFRRTDGFAGEWLAP